MSEPKTVPTDEPVAVFLDREAGRHRADADVLLAMLGDITGVEPVMWGTSLVGFGRYTYTYASGRSGTWPVTAFSPRTSALTVYVMPGFDRYQDLLARLGRHRTGASCLYLRRLDDVDLDVLRDLLTQAVAELAPQRVE